MASFTLVLGIIFLLISANKLSLSALTMPILKCEIELITQLITEG